MFAQISELYEENTRCTSPYAYVCLVLKKEFFKSIPVFNQSLLLYKTLPDSYYYLAICAKALNKTEQAKVHLTHCETLFTTGYRFTLDFIQPFKTIYLYDIHHLGSQLTEN